MLHHVLLVHNFYRSNAPSGEDKAFTEDRKLLESKGHRISLFERYSDSIDEFSLLKKASLLWQTTWSRKSHKAIEELIVREKPDIAHICNTFPLISPSVYYACRKHGIPVVQGVHNYRLFCAAGIFFRGDAICEECLRYGQIRAVKYGCYRNSRVQTIPLVCMQQVHKSLRTWTRAVDMYIAVSNFSKQKLVEGGLPGERVAVKPNFFLSMPEPCYEHDNYAIFLGRLSVEKGVRTLLTAWKKLSGIPLKILGDGVLRQEVEAVVKNNGSAIEFLGYCSHEKSLELLRRSRFMVMPSEWYEGFPMTIREAFACGKPVIASRLGAMAEIIEDGETGLLFEYGNAEDLAAKVQWLVEHERAGTQMGRTARAEFEATYTAKKNYETLMSIYETAVTINARKKRQR